MSKIPRPKQRATFRIDPEVVALLRRLPNQTAFVERVLREALGRVCPLCEGTGEVPDVHLSVSNFKDLPVRRLDRRGAAQLKTLVRLGRELMATELQLEALPSSGRLAFRLARQGEQLLVGTIPGDMGEVQITH
ncbi:MAG: hypothetical protein J4G09_02705 [Proteobacteria bacterium]|nr:hypothetical protein [Pseudomonadota bacterium]